MRSAAPTAVRASFSPVAHRRAISSAAFSRLGVDSARRNVLTSAPVLIWTGHGIAQLPSTAQVSMPSYSYSSCSFLSSGDPSGWRAISNGHDLRVTPDALGLILIEPDRAGPISIDLVFDGGFERKLCRLLSLLTAVLALAALKWIR